MYTFSMSIPTVIRFGPGEVRNVGIAMKECADTVLLLYGSERIFRCGTGAGIVADLEEAGCRVVRLGGVPANTDSQFIDQAIQIVRSEEINGILAVGGGSVIDSAKAIAVGACANKGILEVFRSGETGDFVLPLGAVVTIPATGSEANAVAVITDHETHRKYTGRFPQAKPRFAILDPELTLSVPPQQTAIGGFDIFSHAFERYFDLRRGSVLLDELTLALMRTVVECLPALVKDPENLKLRSEIMFAATVAHSDMLGPGGDFGCHGLSHFLTEVHGISHGGGLAMLIPAWCQVMRHHDEERFRTFYRGVFGVEDLEEGQRRLEGFVQAIGLPRKVGETMDAASMTKLTLEAGRSIGSGFRVMEPAEIEAVYEALR